jgi:hypothetical protein
VTAYSTYYNLPAITVRYQPPPPQFNYTDRRFTNSVGNFAGTDCLRDTFSQFYDDGSIKYGAAAVFERDTYEWEAIFSHAEGTPFYAVQNAFAGLNASTATLLDRDKICYDACMNYVPGAGHTQNERCVMWMQSRLNPSDPITSGSCTLYKDFSGPAYSPPSMNCNMRAGYVYEDGCSVAELVAS